MITSSTASAAGPTPTLLLSGLDGGSGSTVGPGGALYVTESKAGRISRVDPRTGKITTFASGLPKQILGVGVGGTIDVAFIGGTAYALVTLVGPDVEGGNDDIVGIYRIDGPDSFTVVAKIGEFALRTIRRKLSSKSRPESSTRWRPTAAGSWSPMGTTTGSTRSPAPARSAS